jgi:regulator of replication initiation timing
MPTIFYRPPPPAKPKPGPTVMTVKAHQPWQGRLVLFLVVMVMGGGGLFLCQSSLQVLGHNKQTFIEQQVREQEAQRQQIKMIAQDNASLTTQNKELREKLATLIHTTQSSQATYVQVLQSLRQAQTNVQDLTEELQVYKTLLDSTTTVQTGNEVNINSFSISYDEVSGYYQYRLVLIQPNRAAKPVQGQWQLKILGQSNGVDQQLNMNQIMPDNRYSQPYQIHRFQKLEGYLQFPNNFKPKQVIIRLIPAQLKTAPALYFQWSDLLNKESL